MALIMFAVAVVVLGTPAFGDADLWSVVGVVLLFVGGLAFAMIREDRRRARAIAEEEAAARAADEQAAPPDAGGAPSKSEAPHAL